MRLVGLRVAWAGLRTIWLQTHAPATFAEETRGGWGRGVLNEPSRITRTTPSIGTADNTDTRRATQLIAGYANTRIMGITSNRDSLTGSRSDNMKGSAGASRVSDNSRIRGNATITGRLRPFARRRLARGGAGVAFQPISRKQGLRFTR